MNSGVSCHVALQSKFLKSAASVWSFSLFFHRMSKLSTPRDIYQCLQKPVQTANIAASLFQNESVAMLGVKHLWTKTPIILRQNSLGWQTWGDCWPRSCRKQLSLCLVLNTINQKLISARQTFHRTSKLVLNRSLGNGTKVCLSQVKI